MPPSAQHPKCKHVGHAKSLSAGANPKRVCPDPEVIDHTLDDSKSQSAHEHGSASTASGKSTVSVKQNGNGAESSSESLSESEA